MIWHSVMGPLQRREDTPAWERRALTVLLAVGPACDRREGSAEAEAVYVPVATQPATQSTGWTGRQVEEDPDGYLRWWDQQIDRHVGPLRSELEELARKRQAWEGTWRVLAENVALVEGISCI